jgi:hypothetical protein
MATAGGVLMTLMLMNGSAHWRRWRTTPSYGPTLLVSVSATKSIQFGHPISLHLTGASKQELMISPLRSHEPICFMSKEFLKLPFDKWIH